MFLITSCLSTCAIIPSGSGHMVHSHTATPAICVYRLSYRCLSDGLFSSSQSALSYFFADSVGFDWMPDGNFTLGTDYFCNLVSTLDLCSWRHEGSQAQCGSFGACLSSDFSETGTVCSPGFISPPLCLAWPFSVL